MSMLVVHSSPQFQITLFRISSYMTSSKIYDFNKHTRKHITLKYFALKKEHSVHATCTFAKDKKTDHFAKSYTSYTFIFHHCFSHSEIDLNIYVTFMRFLKHFSEIFTWLPLHLTQYSVCVVGSEDLCEDLREPQDIKRKKMRYRVFWSWRTWQTRPRLG